jgi:succinate dehydrogenase/fumarate reductase flavoprotein subunit
MNSSHNIDKFLEFKFKKYDTIIIGSGAAGLNCALHLVNDGIEPSKIAIITEKLGGGTSFNAGSDKQTYYKLSIIGEQQDSPIDMAQDLYSGGAMHGDIALIEATNSIREFFHLVQLGVPFPHDKYGGYVGYKTDYDPKQRATSIGPLTSQKMCECLLKAVNEANITIFDNYYAVEVIINPSLRRDEAIGIIAMDIKNLSKHKDLENLVDSIKIFQAKNIILATGGPAALYKYSVYPKSQWGGMGLAIKAGCKLQNLTESQFGLASIKFRWNLSGSYQQVIPRYFSLDTNGKESEFLNQYFDLFSQLSKAIFLKGYQWPFNSERIENQGSSLIDLAVYYETEILGNKVFLDYRNNPEYYDQNQLDPLAKKYLENSNALLANPIKRLKKLNKEAYELYKNHNIDLTKVPLEIALCNQHLNGGVSGDIWWETNIKHLFAIGEINGSHGIHRPGGAALNSGQVGGLRVAQKIGNVYNATNYLENAEFKRIVKIYLKNVISEIKNLISNENAKLKPKELLTKIEERMEKFGSIIRPFDGLQDAEANLTYEIENYNSMITLDHNLEFLDYLRVKDALLTQQYILRSILNYHESYGASRGSYLILRDSLNPSFKEEYILPPDKLNCFKFIKSEKNFKNKIQTIQSVNGEIKFKWEETRMIPEEFEWFETIWKKYKEEKIFE